MLVRLLPPLIALTLIASCSKDLATQAQHCASDPQCPSGSRCTGGVCSGDTRPTAAIADPGRLEEFALVTLDGSASADPDGDVSTHRWIIHSIDAPCRPPDVAGREALAVVRFACPGKYEVTLTVADALGLESDPARRQFVVEAAKTRPFISAGPDLQADHKCEGKPLRCRATVALQLAGATSGELPAGATLRWAVQPPIERPLDGTRRVTFSNDSDPKAIVDIVTDGTAISGDWVFRLEAFDAHGVLSADATRVSIRNTPPIVRFGRSGPFPHEFDKQRSLFRSSGVITWTVSDPDGDPVEETAATWRHVGDGEHATFDGELSSTAVSFNVTVPYATREDALKLRGGADLVRQIELHATDVNRAMTVGTYAIEIANRPPVMVKEGTEPRVAHRFDPQRSRYVAYVKAGAFADPDGDPIVDASSPGLCGTLHADAAGEITVECSVRFEGVPIADQLVGERTFTVPASDPWEPATQVPIYTVEIMNTPPVAVPGPPSKAEVCADWWYGSDHCPNEVNVNAVAFDVDVAVSDPDGDPVLVGARTSPGGSFSPTGMTLRTAGTIPFHFAQAAFFWHCYTGNEWPISSVTVSDGTPLVRVGVSPKPQVTAAALCTVREP